MSIEGCPSHITDFVFEGCPKGSPGLRGSKMSLLNIRVRVQSITFWRGIFYRKSFLPQGPGQRSFDSRIARWREIMSKTRRKLFVTGGGAAGRVARLGESRWRGWEHCPRDPTLPSPFLCPGPLGVPPSTPLSWTYCSRGGRYIYWGISIMSFLLSPGPRGGVYCSISKLYVYPHISCIYYEYFGRDTTSILVRYISYML